MNKTLISQMRNALKIVKEAVEPLDSIEDNMSEIDTAGFKKKITIDQLPQSIQSVLKFPYISNINVIDRITLNEDTNQVMVQFKIAFKKLSDLFITKAVQNGLISANKAEKKDRIISMGTNNLRMILVFQLIDGIKNETPKEDDEDIDLDNIETDESESDKSVNMKKNPDDYKMAELKESPTWWTKENKIDGEFETDLKIGELVQTVYKYNSGRASQDVIKNQLKSKIESASLSQRQLRTLYYQAGGNLSQVPGNVTVSDLVDKVYDFAMKKSVNESEVEEIISYPSVNAFQQAMSNLAMIISQSVSDAATDEEKKEIKEIWSETSKELNNLIKGI